MEPPRVWMEFDVGGRRIGRVEFTLRSDVVPRTCENFRALCTGERGRSRITAVPLSYVGSRMHRLIPNFMLQGGDLAGTSGGESIYGASFEDENFTLRHDAPGLLSMANAGPNTGSSQFFVTLAPCAWLDGRHVVFGEVASGMAVIEALSRVATGPGDAPKLPITIVKCGQVGREEAEEEVGAGAAAPVTLSDVMPGRGHQPRELHGAGLPASFVSGKRGKAGGNAWVVEAEPEPEEAGARAASPPPEPAPVPVSEPVSSAPPPPPGSAAARLAALQARMAEGRRDNKSAVVAEHKRAEDPLYDVKRAAEERAAAAQAAARSLAASRFAAEGGEGELPLTRPETTAPKGKGKRGREPGDTLHESAGAAEARAEKKEEAAARAVDMYGWNGVNTAGQRRMYDKLVSQLPAQAGGPAPAAPPGASSLALPLAHSLGGARSTLNYVDPVGLERLSASLSTAQAKREAGHRKSEAKADRVDGGAAGGSINAANAAYTKKLSKSSE